MIHIETDPARELLDGMSDRLRAAIVDVIAESGLSSPEHLRLRYVLTGQGESPLSDRAVQAVQQHHERVRAEAPGKSLAAMAAEIRANNIEKGWRNPDGSPTVSWAAGLALIHSEISEALEAYRDYGVEDATDYDNGDPCADPVGHRHKPEGVGSELADVLIRLIDLTDAYGVPLFDMDNELADVPRTGVPAWACGHRARPAELFAWLHYAVAQVAHHEQYLELHDKPLAHALQALVTVAEFELELDLMAEYERKMAYNRTRAFRHGGRSL